MIYTDEYKSIRFSVKAGITKVLWVKCPVCSTTRATLPWWKRIYFVKSNHSFGNPPKYHFESFCITERTLIWGLCSDECLNMFYLGNEV